jgi:hypothetical protein
MVESLSSPPTPTCGRHHLAGDGSESNIALMSYAMVMDVNDYDARVKLWYDPWERQLP